MRKRMANKELRMVANLPRNESIMLDARTLAICTRASSPGARTRRCRGGDARRFGVDAQRIRESPAVPTRDR